jgi:hypothetical protein
METPFIFNRKMSKSGKHPIDCSRRDTLYLRQKVVKQSLPKRSESKKRRWEDIEDGQIGERQTGKQVIMTDNTAETQKQRKVRRDKEKEDNKRDVEVETKFQNSGPGRQTKGIKPKQMKSQKVSKRQIIVSNKAIKHC